MCISDQLLLIPESAIIKLFITRNQVLGPSLFSVLSRANYICFNTLGIIGYYSQWHFVMINDKLSDNHMGPIATPIAVVPMWIEIQ